MAKHSGRLKGSKIVYGTDSGIYNLAEALENSTAAEPGQQAYTSSGVYSFTVPAGVTSICVVCVGGGGGSAGYVGGNGPGSQGGGGGALAYKNNWSVRPGETIQVGVGSGGAMGSSGGGNGSAGGSSYISYSGNICTAGGGAGGVSGSTVSSSGGTRPLPAASPCRRK